MNLNISINKKDLEMCKKIIDLFAGTLIAQSKNDEAKRLVIQAVDFLYGKLKLRDSE